MTVRMNLVDRKSGRHIKNLFRIKTIVYGNVLLEFEDIEDAQKFTQKVGNNVRIFLEECLELL